MIDDNDNIDAELPCLDLPDVLTLDDVASTAHVSASTVIELLQAGTVCGYPIGSSWLILREDLAAILMALGIG